MAYSKNYLQLEFGSGKFFQYSKEQLDGYVKNVSKNGKVSFRKYYNEGIHGVLDSVSIYDGKFGQQISISIRDNEEVYYLPISIYTQSQQVDNTYAESLIKLLPELNKGDIVTVSGYNFKPEGSEYSKIGISIKKGAEKIKSSITNSYYKDGNLVPGDIPAIEWVEKLGKRKPSASSIEAKDEYLLSLLQKEEARLTWKTDSGSEPAQAAPAPKQEQTKVQQAAPAIVEGESDDLPF